MRRRRAYSADGIRAVPDFSPGSACFLYRPAAMPGLEIHPFAEEHLDDAARLLEERHRRHRQAEPLLGADYDYRAELTALDDATGVAGTRNGRVVGYLLGVRHDDARWARTAWTDLPGN